MTSLPVLNGARNASASGPAARTIDGAADLQQIARELTAAVAGEVRFGHHDRMLYATDASLYQVEPLGVFIPASVEDVVAGVRFCDRHGLPILPRGGGTSLAGQCTNRAVVMDLSPNCRRVLEVNGEARTCRVEPGITVDDLNDVLSPTGLFFAPDPATSKHANVGGCIGNNAAGARSILYGRTSENVLGVDVALADGFVARLEAGAASRHPRLQRLTRQVADVVLAHAKLIDERFPKTVRRNAGYSLDLILKQLRAGNGDLDGVNLAHLLCGSEGTLAVTLGAHLQLHPKPATRGLAVLGFASLDEAMDVVNPILTTKPSAVELLDDTVVDLARANNEYRRYVELMPAPTQGILKAVLYVEYFCGSQEELSARFAALKQQTPGVAIQTHTDASAMLNAWKLRKAGEPLLHGIPGNRKPLTFVEDNAVPVENLPRFVKEFRKIVERHGTRAAFYAHASVGVLHVRPLLDLHDEADRDRLRAIGVEIADLAKSLGGVMSGEHGDGRIRSPLLERFYGPELMGAFKQIKQIFDPKNLLNPGNIVDLTGEYPRPISSMTEKLRIKPGAAQLNVPSVATYFNYDDQHGFDAAVEMCNGAGVCRKKAGGTMCPSYMATMDERHATRGRGNALRLAITGQAESSVGGAPAWNDADTLETLHLCLSCKACKTECPSNVDISRLKAEYTAQRFKAQGRPDLKALLLGNVRVLNRLGSIMPGVTNFMLRSTLVRGIMNRVLGFDARRSMPPAATSLAGAFKPALRTHARRGDDVRPVVVLFGDCFTMFNEPGIGRATKQVFETLGYRVELADAGCCGRAMISMGALEQATTMIDGTLERLRPWIEDEQVKAILVAEPSCLSAMKDDWRQLKLECAEKLRRAAAAKAFLPEEFFERAWNEHPRRAILKTSAGEVLLHGHCHQKALWGAETSAAGVRRIAGKDLQVLDTGCCGMAGSFGYSEDRFELSQKIGGLTLYPAVDAKPAATVIAPGTSCRHQLHDHGTKALHPIEFIAKAMEG